MDLAPLNPNPTQPLISNTIKMVAFLFCLLILQLDALPIFFSSGVGQIPTISKNGFLQLFLFRGNGNFLNSMVISSYIHTYFLLIFNLSLIIDYIIFNLWIILLLLNIFAICIPFEYELVVRRRVCCSKTIDIQSSGHVVGEITSSYSEKLTAG